VNEGGRFSIGLQSANVVAEVFAKSGGNAPLATRELTAALAAHAREVHRIAAAIEQQTGWKYWGLDPTPVPLKNESIGLDTVPLPGDVTETQLARISGSSATSRCSRSSGRNR
jgi:hypothetical protein